MGNGICGAGAILHGGPVVFHCYGPDGQLKWEERVPKNLVVNAGLQKLLDVLFAGSAVVDPWYVGLVGTSATLASANTMSAHAGWTEIVGYTQTTRVTYIDVRTNQSVSNSGSAATFGVNTAISVSGALLASTNNKGGSTGVLLCVVAFTGGDRSAADNDTINVTYTFDAADS